MAKKLISEQTIQDAARRGEKKITIDGGTIITAAAKDRAKQLGIRIEQKDHNPSRELITPMQKTAPQLGSKEIIAIGSDHGGFQLKEILKPFLESLDKNVVDLGTYSEESCDYPDFAYAVARTISLGNASKGIMIDSIGLASAIVANKLPGIRAVCCFDEYSAKSSREHNDANILTLGGKVLGSELAKSVVKIWIETNFGGGRHQKRVQKIADIEKRVQSGGEPNR
ncbi:MAG TPA: ribose 5-phosphate isomerase B [Bacteroidota bacterium]|nr:ribose 5-phosphate isomerase B [Bacteroidota bacterium]